MQPELVAHHIYVGVTPQLRRDAISRSAFFNFTATIETDNDSWRFKNCDDDKQPALAPPSAGPDQPRQRERYLQYSLIKGPFWALFKAD